MNVVSLGFALFLLAVLPLNWALRPYPRLYRPFLLAASWWAYGTYDLGFLLLLIQFSFFTWLLPWAMARSERPVVRKALLALHVCLGLSQLAFFKYFDIFFDWTEQACHSLGLSNPLPLWDILLPVGVSFFTFQGLSYAIDVYRDRSRVATNLLDPLCFVAFFPTILSGPILRAGQFIPQLYAGKCDDDQALRGFALLLSGLLKKLVFASYIGEHLVQDVFDMPELYSSLAAALAAFGYSIQILCDFPGYTDLALGVGLLLGFQLPGNFDRPYSSLNLREFWGRWHISFSTWLRDYLYISLGGNRHGKLRKHLNLLATMALGGLWHGAGLNFLVWGLLHGAGLVVTHFFRDRQAAGQGRQGLLPRALGRPLAWAATFCFVTLAWVFFRAENFGQAMSVLGRIASLDGEGEAASIPAGVLAAFVLLLEVVGWEPKKIVERGLKPLPLLVRGLILGALFTIVVRLGPDGAPQFIYFQF